MLPPTALVWASPAPLPNHAYSGSPWVGHMWLGVQGPGNCPAPALWVGATTVTAAAAAMAARAVGEPRPWGGGQGSFEVRSVALLRLKYKSSTMALYNPVDVLSGRDYNSKYPLLPTQASPLSNGAWPNTRPPPTDHPCEWMWGVDHRTTFGG